MLLISIWQVVEIKSNWFYIKLPTPLFGMHQYTATMLVHVDNVGSLVLKCWKSSDIKITIQDTGDYYFNPNTMSWLAVTEGIDINEDESYGVQLQCDYTTHNGNHETKKKTLNSGFDECQDHILFKSVEQIQLCLSGRQAKSTLCTLDLFHTLTSLTMHFHKTSLRNFAFARLHRTRLCTSYTDRMSNIWRQTRRDLVTFVNWLSACRCMKYLNWLSHKTTTATWIRRSG